MLSARVGGHTLSIESILDTRHEPVGDLRARSSAPPSEGPHDERRRKRRRKKRSSRQNAAYAREVAFWLFAVVTVLVSTYIALKLNEGSP